MSAESIASWFAPDFATILANCRDTMHDAMEFPSYIDVDVLLAAKVPELCPDCKGLGCTCMAFCGRTDAHVCPSCPTIGQMLAEWEPLTALAEYAQCLSLRCGWGGGCTCGLDAARAALEAVRRG